MLFVYWIIWILVHANIVTYCKWTTTTKLRTYHLPVIIWVRASSNEPGQPGWPSFRDGDETLKTKKLRLRQNDTISVQSYDSRERYTSMFHHFGCVSCISSRSTGLKFSIRTDNKIRPDKQPGYRAHMKRPLKTALVFPVFDLLEKPLHIISQRELPRI